MSCGNHILTVRSETQPATPIHSTNQFTEIKWNWWEWKELRQVKRGMNSINHFKRIDFISFIIITVITWLLFISISLCYKVWAKKKSMIIEFELRVIIFCYCFVFTSCNLMKALNVSWNAGIKWNDVVAAEVVKLKWLKGTIMNNERQGARTDEFTFSEEPLRAENEFT